MTSQEEFKEKVQQLRSTIDYHRKSPEQNREILQKIKEYCATVLSEPSLSLEFEKEIMDTLFSVEREMKSILMGAHGLYPSPLNTRGNNGIEQVLKPLDDSQENMNNVSTGLTIGNDSMTSLNSVKASGFDPMSSPILRRLILEKRSSFPRVSSSSLAPQIRQTEPNESLSLPNNHFDQKSLSENNQALSQNEPTEIPSQEKTKYRTLLIKLPQLKTQLELTLTEGDPHSIGREDLISLPMGIRVPEGFFEPIDEKQHMEILLKEDGLYIRDPKAGERVYYNDHFLTSDFEKVSDGDRVIFPVHVNNKLSSLYLEFNFTTENGSQT